MPHRNHPISCRADRRRPWRAAAFALILPMLASCESAGPTADAETGAQQPAPQGGEAAAPFNAVAVVPPPSPPPPPPVNDDPDQLLGLSGDAVADKLGRPSLIRREGDAEIWQYRATRCVLDLFLYGEVKHVEHVDLRDRGDGTVESVRACFVDMLRAAAKTS